MMHEQLEGNWEVHRGRIKEDWGKSADDDVAVSGEETDPPAGKICAKYGLAKEDAYNKLKAMEATSGRRESGSS